MELVWVALVIVLFFFLCLSPVILIKVIQGYARENNKKRLLADGLIPSEILNIDGGIVIFDVINNKVGLITSGRGIMVPFNKVRRWSYEPRYNVNRTQQIGFTFRVTTSDPSCSVINLPMLGSKNNNVAELWMSKFSAYINE